MDRSFHLLNSVQYHLLRHSHIRYSTVAAQNKVLSLDGNEIWIININSPQQKCVPISMSPRDNFRIKQWLTLLCEYEEFNLR